MNKLTTAACAPVTDNQNPRTTDHRDHHIDEDHYSQPGNLFRQLSADKQQLLFENTACFLDSAEPEI